eukprot:scaffold19031_cov110-Isochrysis_galbana.AAC.4
MQDTGAAVRGERHNQRRARASWAAAHAARGCASQEARGASAQRMRSAKPVGTVRRHSPAAFASIGL